MQSELTSDAKILIRQYTTSLFILPGVIGAFLFFFAGFFVNDIFKRQVELKSEQARLEALEESRVYFQGEFLRMLASTADQKSQIDRLLDETKENYEESETLVEQIRATDSVSAGITDQQEIARIVVNALKKDDGFIQGQRSWPSGKYGIWAFGGCPKGFDEKTGFLRALQIFSLNANYVDTNSFGDSSIVVHNNGQSGNMVDLNLSVCIRR